MSINRHIPHAHKSALNASLPWILYPSSSFILRFWCLNYCRLVESTWLKSSIAASRPNLNQLFAAWRPAFLTNFWIFFLAWRNFTIRSTSILVPAILRLVDKIAAGGDNRRICDLWSRASCWNCCRPAQYRCCPLDIAMTACVVVVAAYPVVTAWRTTGSYAPRSSPSPLRWLLVLSWLTSQSPGPCENMTGPCSHQQVS